MMVKPEGVLGAPHELQGGLEEPFGEARAPKGAPHLSQNGPEGALGNPNGAEVINCYRSRDFQIVQKQMVFVGFLERRVRWRGCGRPKERKSEGRQVERRRSAVLGRSLWTEGPLGGGHGGSPVAP